MLARISLSLKIFGLISYKKRMQEVMASSVEEIQNLAMIKKVRRGGDIGGLGRVRRKNRVH